MAFRAVGVLSQSLANALSMILCLVITMGGKKSQKGREKRENRGLMRSGKLQAAFFGMHLNEDVWWETRGWGRELGLLI